MNTEGFNSGEEAARRDIAAGKFQLHHELRGEWGRDLHETLRARFGVVAAKLSCFTNEVKASYEAGYDAAVTAHIDSLFGPGSVAAVYREVQDRRKQRYDKWVAENKGKLA